MAKGWILQEVISTQASVKSELSKIEENEGLKGRLSYAIDKVRDLENDISSRGLMKRFVYTFSALVQYQSCEGLTSAHVKSLTSILFTTLKHSIPKPAKSKMRFLYADFHLLHSQLLRKAGNHWLAAWEQSTSSRIESRHDQINQARQSLGCGIRAIRLGQAKRAISFFDDCDTQNASEGLRISCKFWKIKTYRICGRYSECRKTIEEIRTLDLSPNEHLELIWEEHCLESTLAGNAHLLVEAVQVGGSNHRADYFIEALLWAKASPSLESKLPKLKSIARKKSLHATRQGLFHECAFVIEQCFDHTIPFEFRLKRLGEQLTKSSQIITIHKELLFLAASISWLVRNHCFNHADLVLTKYGDISCLLSGGTSQDALGIMSQYLSKEWRKAS